MSDLKYWERTIDIKSPSDLVWKYLLDVNSKLHVNIHFFFEIVLHSMLIGYHWLTFSFLS